MPLSNSKPAEVKYCHVWLAPTHTNTDTQTNSDSHTHTHVSTHKHTWTHKQPHTHSSKGWWRMQCRGDIYLVDLFIYFGYWELWVIWCRPSLSFGFISVNPRTEETTAGVHNLSLLPFLFMLLLCLVICLHNFIVRVPLSPCFYCASMSVCCLLLRRRLAFLTVFPAC